MVTQTYRYRIAGNVPFSEVEDSLNLAIVAGECLHGPSRARLEVAYSTDQEARACVVDASTEVGQDIARIFTGFLTKEFGGDSFKLDRVRGDRDAAIPSEVRSG